MVLKLNKFVSFGKVGNETMITNEENNKGIKLDDLGSDIWEMIFNGKSKSEIIDHYVSLYPNDKETINDDINDFISTLIDEGFILEE